MVIVTYVYITTSYHLIFSIVCDHMISILMHGFYLFSFSYNISETFAFPFKMKVIELCYPSDMLFVKQAT